MRHTAPAAIATWDIAIEVNNVTKSFPQTRAAGWFKRATHTIVALSDVSFAIKPGEFVAYAGPNGAGKSTTFKLLCGMLAPQSGQVRVFGLDPAKRRIDIMKKTGVLFGNRSELWWDHPVQASFEWKKAVWGIPDNVYDDMLAKVKELLGIDEFMDAFARELSLGQRMRANLGLTLLHAPDLILLDEPTLGLDILAKRRMIDFLKHVNRERGTTILVTSHDLDDLAEMASRIMLINRGALAFDGDIAALNSRTGDARILRVTSPTAAELPGATLIESEDGKHTYAFDAARVTIPGLMRAASEISGITDMETMRPPIESTIAALFRQWSVEK